VGFALLHLEKERWLKRSHLLSKNTSAMLCLWSFLF